MVRSALFSLSAFAALLTACGIDLADGTERVAEEDVTDGATAHEECEKNLESLQAKMASARFSPYKTTDWQPDDSPSKNRRAWPSGTLFDEVGWAPEKVKVQGSYRLVNSGDDFLALCEADVDEDGEKSQWQVTLSTGPVLNSAEGVR